MAIEGPDIFPQRKRAHALIPVRGLSGERVYLRVRWPASTRRKGPPDPPVVPEIIRMGDKPLIRITRPDPYLEAEEE